MASLLRASSVPFWSLHFVDSLQPACAAVSPVRFMCLGRNSITSSNVSHRFEIEDIAGYLGRVCKVFGSILIFSKRTGCGHSTPLECKRTELSLSIDILLRWSKETSRRSGFSSRQRRDISIGVDVSDKCPPAECYVLDRPDMVTLPEYLHGCVKFLET